MVNRIGRFTPVAEHPEPSADALALVSGEMLSTRQAAERLKCSKATLWKLMDSGKIRYCQDGPNCLRVIPASEITRYLASCLK